MRRSDRSAFTLIELMIVLGIIAILAVLALGAYRGNLPRTNTRDDLMSLREAMMKTRSHAIREDSITKILIYRSTNPAAMGSTSPRVGGRWYMFRCDTPGSTGCLANALIGQAGNYADSASASTCVYPSYTSCSTFFNASASTACVANDNNWCILDSQVFSGDDVDVNTFYISNAGTYSSVTDTLLEISFGPDGVSLGSPYGNYVTAKTDMTSIDACTPSPNSCSIFPWRLSMSLFAGGSVSLQ